MRQVSSIPFEDGDGAVVFAAYGRWGPRLRTVALVAGGVRGRRRVVGRRALRAFAGALDARRLPAGLPGSGAVVEQDPETRLPYGLLRHEGGTARVSLAGLASAARGTAAY